jgi:hypothetical protein
LILLKSKEQINKKESKVMTDVRRVTNYLLDSASNGGIEWETIAREALKYMSEDKVSDMAWCAGFISVSDMAWCAGFISDDLCVEDDEDEDENDYEEGDRIEEPPFLGENDFDTDLFDGDIYAVYHE